MGFNVTYMQALMGIVIACFAIDLLTLVLLGIRQHTKNLHIPALQGRAMGMMAISFMLQSTIFVGFFVYQWAEIFDILVEVLISVLLFMFFQSLGLLLAMEAFNVCHSGDLETKRKASKELQSLAAEIKAMPGEKVFERENVSKSVMFMLMATERFKHLRVVGRCLGERVVGTREQAAALAKRNHRILLVYVVVVPMCFLVNAVLEARHSDKRVARIVVNLIKGLTTGFCMYNLIFYVKNLEETMQAYGLLVKFFCVKLIIFFQIVQTIVLSFIDFSTEEFSEVEMQHIINFFMMNIENCLLGFVWVYSFGYNGLAIENFRELKTRTSSNGCNSSELGLNQKNNESIEKPKVKAQGAVEQDDQKNGENENL